jgi:WXG100 family type VII secretion target
MLPRLAKYLQSLSNRTVALQTFDFSRFCARGIIKGCSKRRSFAQLQGGRQLGVASGIKPGHSAEARMSQAIVDPNELRRFAQNLKKFNQELEERLTSLRAQLHSLSATWRDQEHKKFVEDFEEHMKVIGRYVEVTNEHAPFLMRKAERIEEYLQQR